MTNYIDYTKLTACIYDEYIADKITDIETIEEIVYEILTDDVLEEYLNEWMDCMVTYTADCEKIVNEYGIEDAVNLYIRDMGIDGDFSIASCAYLVLMETQEYGWEDIREFVVNLAREEYKD